MFTVFRTYPPKRGFFLARCPSPYFVISEITPFLEVGECLPTSDLTLEKSLSR